VSRAGIATAALGAGALALLAAGARPAAAESRYSLRGDGESVSSATADSRARGGAEIASDTPSLSLNPASLAFADRTTFYGTYDLEWIRTEEHLAAGGGGLRKDYANLVPNLALIFPLPRNLHVATGLLVQRRRSGTIVRDVSIDNGNGGTVTYRQEFTGSGSLLQVPLAVAYDAGRAQVGAGVDLLLLGSDVTWRNDFTGEGEVLDFVDSEDREENSLHGVAFRAGIRVPLGDRLAVGAYTALPSELSGELRFSSEQAGDTHERVEDRSADVAPAWGVGAEVRPAEGLRIAADWTRESWSEADPLDPAETFTDVDRIAVGAEWKSGGERGSLQWPVRLGYRTENLHALDAFGEEVREHVISGGSGFNIAGGRGDIDWYLEYGWRGESGVTEYREDFVRFGVTLTGWESWGRLEKPEEEDDW
jgi:hypothetical protein